MKRATIIDVARHAGVSRQTVSRAINNKADISPQTKQRVMQAIEELGYRPNRLAQSMVTQRTLTIGLILGNITNPFFPEVTRGVQDAALEHDYNVILCNADDRRDLELNALRSLASQGVDGIILFAHNSTSEQLSAFADTFRPIVIINRAFDHPNIAYIMVDNIKGGQLAANYFIDQGHTELGVITNTTMSLSQVRRIQGFIRGAAARGIAVPEAHIVARPADLEGGHQGAHELLDNSPNVTAIFTYNDLMAFGAIRALSERGLNIPNDVAVIGFDDIRFASISTPALSSIHVDKYAIGQIATELLLQMVDDPSLRPKPLQIDVRLMQRESS